MAFRNTDKSQGDSPSDRSRAATRQLTDAVDGVSTPRSSSQDVVSSQERARTSQSDENLPSPDTPLRERRLPASFWQEPNVPRRTSPWRAVSRRADGGRTGSAAGTLHHHRQTPTCLDFTPQSQPTTAAAALLHRRHWHYHLPVAWSPTVERHAAFLRGWKDAPSPAAAAAFNFDVPLTKPPPPIDFVRQLAHLSPWSAGLQLNPGGYPPLTASDHGVNSSSEELAASAAVVAAYLRWRAVEEDFKPVHVDAVPTPPPSAEANWSSMYSTMQPCTTAATASVAIQRFRRYHPY